MQCLLLAGSATKCGNLHCSLLENFTGVTTSVVFDNDVDVIVIKHAAVVIVYGAAVAVVNVVNAHACGSKILQLHL